MTDRPDPYHPVVKCRRCGFTTPLPLPPEALAVECPTDGALNVKADDARGALRRSYRLLELAAAGREAEAERTLRSRPLVIRAYPKKTPRLMGG